MIREAIKCINRKMGWRKVDYVSAKRNANGLFKKVLSYFFNVSYSGLRNKCYSYYQDDAPFPIVTLPEG